jgi:uncharacterized protein with HEPN domain
LGNPYPRHPQGGLQNRRAHAGNGFRDVRADEWLLDAVLRNLTVIGEAARHVPDAVRAERPQVPWRDMQDLRNLVVHEYFGVDLAVIWRTVCVDLPELLKSIEDAFGNV